MKSRIHLIFAAVWIVSAGWCRAVEATVSVSERGPHYRVLQFVKEVETPYGMTFETNEVIEFQSGLHRWTDQGWVVTDPRLEISVQDGGRAVANNLQYRASFAPNLATPGAVDLMLPEGRLTGHVLGIAFTEGNRSVMVGEVKDCVGVIGGAEQNELTYADAFTDNLGISVKYVTQRAGVSQSLIFSRQLPSPLEWGLTEDAIVEVLTEFIAFPELRAEAREPVAGMTVEHLSFGSTEFVTGLGFSIGGEANSVAVFKSWDQFEGDRWFLVEKVPWKWIAPELAKLPAVAKTWRKNNKTIMARNQLRLPARREAHAPVKPIQRASISPPTQGYVIDWDLVSSVNSNLWKRDITYYVSGLATIKTNIFEGGCVIKYAPTNSAKLKITGPVTLLNSNYSPVIMTARDDHNVGEPIGTNALTGYYASTAMELDYGSSGTIYNIHDFRVSHATVGITFFAGRGHTARNIQIVNCDYGFSSYFSTYFILNGLAHKVNTGFTGSGASGVTSVVENVTFNQSRYVFTNVTLYATNSLLVACTNIYPFTGAYNGTNSNPSSVFQSVGAGANYLITNSSFRNAGTTNVDAGLVSALKQLTTDPPIIAGNLAVIGNTNMNLTPRATRDSDTPDLGFHYSPLDYAFGGAYITNATITLSNGTAIAIFSPTNGGTNYYGIRLGDTAKLFSDASPTNLNKIARYNMVQEQWNTSWNTAPTEHIASDWTNPPHDPEAKFRFTEWSMPAKDTYHFRGYTNSGCAPSFVDCQFHGGRFYSARPTPSVTNSLFNRVVVVLEDSAGTAMNPIFRNCLLYGGSLSLTNSQGGTWTLKDNMLDRVSVSQSGTITHDYNGYVTNATNQVLVSGGGHDAFTNSFTYQNGALGIFYQPTTSPFIGVGSTTANSVGMYHYTVLTNNTKEANSTVDMGLHYVATTNGVPIDSDGDGLPDYLEDPNGNGITDIGENSFANPVLIVATPVNYVRGSPPYRLDTNAVAYDSDSPNFGSGQLKVQIVVYANSNDRLAIRNEGTNAAQIGISTNTITYGGTNIGTFSGGVAADALVITFNSSASSAAVQALARNLTFQNISNTTAVSSRIVQYVLTDGHGGVNSPTFQTINVVCPQGVDVMIVIDISQSVTNAFQQIKEAASNFVRRLDFSTDRVGLISFAGDSYLNSPLTNNGSNVQSLIYGLTNASGTRFQPPLDMAHTNLTNASVGVTPLAVLLSDGQSGGTGDFYTNRVEATNACLALKDAGIRLIALAYGTVTGTNGGTNLMQWFASSASDYYHAPTGSVIQSKYDSIAQGLCRPASPPVISITTPTDGTKLFGPATFRIETYPTDADGIVKKVEFFNGTNSLGIVTNLPFHLIWNNVPAGTYPLTAVATDDDNLSTTSAVVVVTITNCSSASLYSLTLDTSTIIGGLSTTGKVTISTPALPGGQPVNLLCTNPFVSIPASLLVPEGTTNVSFRIDTRSVTQQTATSIEASLHGVTLSTNLTLASTNFQAPDVFRGQCGPMDVAFLVAYGNTMSYVAGTNVNVGVTNAAVLSNIVDAIEFASGNDYRLALVGITNGYHIMTEFAMTNRQAFLTSLPLLANSTPASYPQPYDEALNMVINNLSDDNRPKQYGDFTNGFRANARKVIVLIVDRPPSSFTNAFYLGIDDVNAHWRAVEAWTKGIQICTAIVKTHHWQDNDFSAMFPILQDCALTTGGFYVDGAEDGTNLNLTLPRLVSQCGADIGGVVFIRDDTRQMGYAGVTLNYGVKEASATDYARFDTTGVDGEVVAARLQRNGELRLNYGSHFDLQIGGGSAFDTNIASFGLVIPSADTNLVAKLYDCEWDLPFSFYGDLESQLGRQYLVKLIDRVNAACGNNFEIVDWPAADFPAYRTELLFKVLRPFEIPQGRCRDFVLTGRNAPVGETWEIRLWDRVIASTSIAKGWSVAPDYTAYGGFNIGVPTNALVSKLYEVRYSDAQGAARGIL